jgi:hypothetical protein
MDIDLVAVEGPHGARSAANRWVDHVEERATHMYLRRVPQMAMNARSSSVEPGVLELAHNSVVVEATVQLEHDALQDVIAQLEKTQRLQR